MLHYIVRGQGTQMVIVLQRGDYGRWKCAAPGRHVTIAMGDWNFLPPSERRVDYVSPSSRPAPAEGLPRSVFADPLGRMVDIDHDMPTHFSRAGGAGCRIARIHVAVPGWIPLCKPLSGTAEGDRMYWDQKGWSDHVLV